MLLQKNLPFFNVVANGVASLSLPLGMTYERIVFTLGFGSGGAFTKAMMTDIKVKLNGKVIVQTTGTRLDTINKYKGIYDDASHLTLDFTEVRARDEVGQSLGAITTASGVSNFTIEVTITGANAPTLESHSLLSAPRQLGVIHKMLHYPVTFSAGGTFPIVLPYGTNGGALIKRVHFFHANMTGLEVKKNGLVLHESVTAINEFLQREYQKTPQAGLYCFDALLDNNSTQMLLTADARSMEWKPTVSAGDTIDVQVEFLDLLGNN